MMRYLLAILLCAGCASHRQCSQVFYGSYLALRQGCEKTLERHGYTPCPPEGGVLKTEWKENLYPLRRGGHRTRAVLEIIPQDRILANVVLVPQQKDGIGFYQLQLKVVREVNYCDHDFMDPKHAVWLADGYDFSAESLLIQEIETGFYLKAEPDISSGRPAGGPAPK